MQIQEINERLRTIEAELTTLDARRLALRKERNRLEHQLVEAKRLVATAGHVPCPECPKKFSTKDGLAAHIKAKHEPKVARIKGPSWVPMKTSSQPQSAANSPKKPQAATRVVPAQSFPVVEPFERSAKNPNLALKDDASVNPIIRARLARHMSSHDLARLVGDSYEVVMAVESGRRKALPRAWRDALHFAGWDFKRLEAQYKVWLKETEHGATIRPVGEPRRTGQGPAVVVGTHASPPRKERDTFNGVFRQSNGQFGSYPLHDDYSEESFPNGDD